MLTSRTIIIDQHSPTALEACPNNIHHRLIRTITKEGQFGHPHWEGDIVHNSAYVFSMFDHVGPPTTIVLKGEPFTHVK